MSAGKKQKSTLLRSPSRTALGQVSPCPSPGEIRTCEQLQSRGHKAAKPRDGKGRGNQARVRATPDTPLASGEVGAVETLPDSREQEPIHPALWGSWGQSPGRGGQVSLRAEGWGPEPARPAKGKHSGNAEPWVGSRQRQVRQELDGKRRSQAGCGGERGERRGDTEAQTARGVWRGSDLAKS